MADDQALLAWVRAYESGGNARAQLDRVDKISVATTAAKEKFLGIYGAARRTATGLSPSSLPADY